MNKKLLVFFPLFLVGLLLPLHVRAEYCDMVGCYGLTWIYIPRSQYEGCGYKEFSVGEVKYTIDRSLRLFKEDKLPEIGEIVTLNMNVSSFNPFLRGADLSKEKQKRWLKIKQVERQPFIIEDTKKKKFINDQAYEGCGDPGRRGDWDLNKGMKLKIRSYQHVENILFAWVEIINEPYYHPQKRSKKSIKKTISL